ncbi:Bestrophin-3 [Nymphon striatum]|nr:Bestrophin-3 [Nymphon striatum]
MGDDRLPKKICQGEVPGRRPRGRPRKSWEKSLKETIRPHIDRNAGDWWDLAQDRAKWRALSRATMDLQDLSIHERNFDLVLSFRSYRVIGYITKSERFALLVSTYIHGSDERSRIIRRTLIRYVNLTIVMTFQLISTAVKKRFPTIDHIQEAGIIVIDITNFKINVILTYFLVELSNSPMSIMPSVLFPLYPLCAIIVVFKSSKRSLYYWLYSAVHDVSFPTTATPPTAAKSLFKVTRSLSQNEQKVTFIRNRPAYDPILMQLHRLLRLTSRLMTNEERSVYDVIVCPTGKWWVPIAWSCSLISRANKEGR